MFQIACFSHSRGLNLQKFSSPVGPNHGGASLVTEHGPPNIKNVVTALDNDVKLGLLGGLLGTMISSVAYKLVNISKTKSYFELWFFFFFFFFIISIKFYVKGSNEKKKKKKKIENFMFFLEYFPLKFCWLLFIIKRGSHLAITAIISGFNWPNRLNHQVFTFGFYGDYSDYSDEKIYKEFELFSGSF